MGLKYSSFIVLILVSLLWGRAALTFAQGTTITPRWQVDWSAFPDNCERRSGILECTVIEGQPIQLILPPAMVGSSRVSSYQLVNQPAYSSYDQTTGHFSWTPYYSSTNGRVHPDGLAGDHRIYLFPIGVTLGNFTVAFRVIDKPRLPTRFPSMPLVDGAPFSPVIAWGVEMPRFPAMRALGFNTVASQNLGHSFEQASRQPGFDRAARLAADLIVVRRYLDTAQENGLKLILIHHIPEIIAQVKDHPALYLVQLPQDEPDIPGLDPSHPRHSDPYYSAARMVEMRADILAVAPNVVVSAVFSARFSGAFTYQNETPEMIEEFRRYFEAVDVVIFDYYLQSGVGDYATIADPRSLVGMLHEAQALVEDRKLVIPLIEASVVYGTIPADQEQFPLTPAHIRSQTEALLDGGAMGIGYYGANTINGLYTSWNVSETVEEFLPGYLRQTFPDTSAVTVFGTTTDSGELQTILFHGDEPLQGDLPAASVSWSVATGPDTIANITCSAQSFASPCLTDLSLAIPNHLGPILGRSLIKSPTGQRILRLFMIDGSETDYCPNDSNKRLPGSCGCGTADVDSDEDGTLDCQDSCRNDPAKSEPGVCGCFLSDADSDGDGIYNCLDLCPANSALQAPGACGCDSPQTEANGSIICTPSDLRLVAPTLSKRGRRVQARAGAISQGVFEFVVVLRKSEGGRTKMTIRSHRPKIGIKVGGVSSVTVRYRIILDQQTNVRTPLSPSSRMRIQPTQ